jgi:hypothetical protein
MVCIGDSFARRERERKERKMMKKKREKREKNKNANGFSFWEEIKSHRRYYRKGMFTFRSEWIKNAIRRPEPKC